MKLSKKYLVVLLGLNLLLIQCFPGKKKDFYEYSKADFDLWRIPLIEPYEIYCTTSKGDNWSVNDQSKLGLKFNDLIGFSVDSIGICDNLIVAFTSNIYYRDGMKPLLMLTYDITEDNGRIFETISSYEEYLSHKNCNRIKLYDPVQLWPNFLKDYSLPPEWPHPISKK